MSLHKQETPFELKELTGKLIPFLTFTAACSSFIPTTSEGLDNRPNFLLADGRLMEWN